MSRQVFILAGGSGERFWPLSRRLRPKQLLRLTDPDKTMLQEAIDRVHGLVELQDIYVVTSRELADPIRNSKSTLSENIWAEPTKRNTLGAVAWLTANLIASGKEDSTLAILTADHKIADSGAFRSVVENALDTAESTGALVVCGISPTRPETGYGYIEASTPDSPSSSSRLVQTFREKPDFETATQFFHSGNFLWNSGMFFWTIRAFLREMEHAEPKVIQCIKKMAEYISHGDLDSAETEFSTLPNLSIDIALMEKAKQVRVVEGSFGWDDLGAWDAVPRALGTNSEGPAEVGDTLAIDCLNSVFYNETDHQVLAAIGIENLAVVATNDAILVCRLDQAQRVKEVVEVLKLDRDHLV